MWFARFPQQADWKAKINEKKSIKTRWEDARGKKKDDRRILMRGCWEGNRKSLAHTDLASKLWPRSPSEPFLTFTLHTDQREPVKVGHSKPASQVQITGWRQRQRSQSTRSAKCKLTPSSAWRKKTPQFPSGSDKGFFLRDNYQQLDVSGSLLCAEFKSHAVAARLPHNNVTAVCTYREKRLADPLLTPYIFKSAGGILAHFRPIWTRRQIIGLCPT